MMTQAREKRLRKARAWLLSLNFTEEIQEARLIKAYRKHFKVDKLCAIKELALLGCLPQEKQAEYEVQWRTEKEKKQKQEQHDDFFFVAGYTSGGIPYGITLEEEMNFEDRIETLKAMSTGVSEELDKLIDGPYCIIDILPQQVSEDRDGQFFAIEKYFSTEPQRSVIRQKFANFVLKLNCYMDVFINGEMNPDPKNIVKAIKNRQVYIAFD
ncbi:MAG: hypothetical protein IJQ47_05395, partial [Synergistaceae bacterium]|nr:hypothetical protein [Synergistaceae bacterium]